MARLITVSILIFCSVINAQKRPEPPGMEFSKRFDQLENIKLLEILNLDEEIAIKFFSRRNSMKTKMKEHMDANNELINRLESMISKGVSDADYRPLIEKSLAIEREFGKVRSEFIKSLDDILNEEQIAKVIVFEFKFKKDVRDMLLERGRRKFIEK